MFQTIYFVISGITIVIGFILVLISSFIFKENYSSAELLEIKFIMICTVLQFVVTFCFNTTAMALQAYEKFIFIRICLLIACVVQPCINIIALYFGGRAVAISVITLITSFVTYTAYFIFAKRKIGLRFIFGKYDKSLLKNIFVFSGFLFLNSITDQLTFSTDNLVLGILLGPVIVAIYALGSNFKNYFMSFSTAVSSVFAPQINKIVAENDSNKKLSEIFIRVERMQFFIVTLIMTGYIFFGRQFIFLWLTNKYEDSYLIGLFLMLSIYVPCFQNIGLEIQKAKDLHKARSIVYFLIAIVNVGMTIPLSLVWLGIGAALATLICMFCGTVIFMNIYNHKKVGIDIISFWKSIIKIFPELAIPVIVGIFINFFIPIESYLSLLWVVLLYCVVYFVSCWFISMNKYEKDLFINPIKKYLRKNCEYYD